MSKTTHMSRKNIRWQLLTTVSAAALLASAYSVGRAQAADNDGDRPTLWIELGGQLESVSSPQEAFSPPFMASITQANLLRALNVQQPPSFAFSEDAGISFQPDDSNWIFSASIQYGRSQATRHHHQQTPNAKIPEGFNLTFGSYHKYVGGYSFYPNQRNRFVDGKANLSEVHTILDFQAGKDVGLGMFGKGGSSVLSAGVRFAQFSSKASVALSGQPDLQYPTKPITSLTQELAFNSHANIHFHGYTGIANVQRNFRGVGPSLAWNASVPLAGSSDRGELMLDWGANAAVLFGRQKAQGHHQTTVKSYYYNRWSNNGAGRTAHLRPGHFFNAHQIQGGPSEYFAYPTAQHNNAASFNRVRSVTVPNFGGFAGLSYRYADAKLSFGYRADFFFNAMDGGMDTRKEENRGFFGPFASISVGLGD